MKAKAAGPAAGKSTVSSKGQVTIPKSVRDRYGLTAGTEVVFEVREDGALLAIFAALNPHLIMSQMKEDASEVTRARLIENEAWWAQAVPGAAILYIGTPWTYPDTNTTTTIHHNLIVRSVALANHRAYVDCMTPVVSYDWLYAHGNYAFDGVHLNLAGSTYLANIAWDDLNFFALRKPRSLVASRVGNNLELSFSTEVGPSYTLQQSGNFLDWSPVMNVSNVSGMQTTNVMLTSSNAFYRLKLTP